MELTATATSSALANITLTVMDGSDKVEVAASGTSQTLNGAVKFNGKTVVTVSGTSDTPVFTGANGMVLTARDLAGLKGLFVFVDRLFAGFDHILVPSYYVFGFGA